MDLILKLLLHTKQRIQINNSLSNYLIITTGVPIGTFFLVYIYDISLTSNSSEINVLQTILQYYLVIQIELAHIIKQERVFSLEIRN